MDYQFKELITVSFSDFLEEKEVNPEQIQQKKPNIKIFSVKGKVIPIKKNDYKKVFGKGRQIVKKKGYKISTNNNVIKFYVPEPPKKGMYVAFDNQSNKFIYIWDRQLFKIRKKMMKKVLKKTAKKDKNKEKEL
jgi:hypothetical protein